MRIAETINKSLMPSWDFFKLAYKIFVMQIKVLVVPCLKTSRKNGSQIVCVWFGHNIARIVPAQSIPASDYIVAFVAFRFSSSFVKFNDRINKVPMDDSYDFLSFNINISAPTNPENKAEVSNFFQYLEAKNHQKMYTSNLSRMWGKNQHLAHVWTSGTAISAQVTKMSTVETFFKYQPLAVKLQ